MVVYYSIEELHGDEVLSADVTGGDIDWLTAQECAEDFHDNHDGWECNSWPYTFALREKEDGPVVGRYAVEREAVPSFCATLIKPVQL
jgi:hypothetical protein